MQATFLTASCNEYQWIINYAKKHQITTMETEVEICKQMIELLPVKISAIRRGVVV